MLRLFPLTTILTTLTPLKQQRLKWYTTWHALELLNSKNRNLLVCFGHELDVHFCVHLHDSYNFIPEKTNTYSGIFRTLRAQIIWESRKQVLCYCSTPIASGTCLHCRDKLSFSKHSLVLPQLYSSLRQFQCKDHFMSDKSRRFSHLQQTVQVILRLALYH